MNFLSASLFLATLVSLSLPRSSLGNDIMSLDNQTCVVGPGATQCTFDIDAQLTSGQGAFVKMTPQSNASFGLLIGNSSFDGSSSGNTASLDVICGQSPAPGKFDLCHIFT